MGRRKTEKLKTKLLTKCGKWEPLGITGRAVAAVEDHMVVPQKIRFGITI